MEFPPLIIRVRFRSGAVSEELGTEAQVLQLVDDDADLLIDYVQTLDPTSGEFSMYVHEDDPNWSDKELTRLFGME